MAVIAGSVSTIGADVDSSHDLMVATQQVGNRANIAGSGGVTGNPSNVGAVRFFCEEDSGALTGVPLLNSPIATAFDNNMQVGVMTPLMDYEFNAAAQDTANWYYAFTTMTITQSGGFLLLNAGNSGASAVGCYLLSKRYFSLTGNGGLRLRFIWGITNNTVAANQNFLIGTGIPASTTSPPPDGVWLRFTNSGVEGILSYNGTPISTGIMPVAQTSFVPALNSNYIFDIRIHDRSVSFWVNDQVLGTINTPVSQGAPFMSDALPLFTQFYNSGVVTGAQFMQIRLASTAVDQLDSNLGKPYPHIQASKGLTLNQGLSGGTMGASAFWASSANPTAALPVGTALTANLPTSLSSGQGLATLWNLAATDMVMSQAQIPLGTVNQTARTYYCTGVRISAITFSSTWTAPAAGTHMWIWGIFYGNTTANPTTAESGSFVTATVKAPRKLIVGSMTWATAATPVATPPDRGDIIASWQTPLICNPGEYIQVIAKMINGAATASGSLFFTYTFDGYFE